MKNFYIFEAILAAFLFGLSTPFSKLILNNNNSPILLAALFYLGAAFFLLPFKFKDLDVEIKSFKKNPSDQKKILLAIIFGGILGPLSLLYGIKLSQPEAASLLLNMETVATTFLAYLIFKEHLGNKVLISSILTIIAGSLLVFDFNLTINFGGVLVVLACFCWGIDNNVTANVSSISPTFNTILKGLFAGTFNLILFFALEYHSVSVSDFLKAMLIGAFSYGLSIILYISSARKIGASRSQIIFSINPFLGSIISFIIFTTTPTWNFSVAFFLMIGAIILLIYEKHHHQHTHHPVTHTHEHTHTDDHHHHVHDQLNPHHKHTHEHAHDKITHTHIHYPDIHHKHEH